MYLPVLLEEDVMVKMDAKKPLKKKKIARSIRSS